MKDIEFRAWLKTEKKIGEVMQLSFNTPYSSFTFAVWHNGLPVGFFKKDEIELMQFTGLCDKNGKKIFEGDIVKCSLIDSFNRIVESIAYVTKDKCGYKLVKIYGDGLNLDDINLWIDAQSENAFIEVIGNIYENKELLECKE